MKKAFSSLPIGTIWFREITSMCLRRVRLSGNGISQTFDGLGRLSTRTVFGRQLSYGYDIASRRTRLTYPDGYYVSYGYTNVDELQTITDSTGATLASYGYDALGFREQLTRPNNANTGYAPNAIEQLQQLTHTFSTASSSFNMTSQFSYNPAGQIASKTQSNDAAYTWLPSPVNQTVSSPADNQNKLAAFQSASVTSDGNGDVESGINPLTYSYDVLGQLRKATGSSGSVTVDYDPSGMLQKETNGSTVTEYLYDGPDLVAEYVNGALAQRFVHGTAADEPLVWFQGSGTSSPSFLHADERGSIIATSNSSGVVTASVKYGSYGESGALVSPFGYTGQLYMPDLQLYYYKARMYSPQTGRFLQPDPMRYGGGLNLYAYAGADPLNLVDPTGLDPDPCGAPYGGVQATVCAPHPPGIVVNGVSTPGQPPPNVGGDGNGGGGNGTSQPPQKDQQQCYVPSFIRRAVREQTDPGGDAAAGAGLGLADLSLTAAERLTENIKAPPDVDLNAIKFLGRGVMIVGAAVSAYEAFNAATPAERNLARQDLLFTASTVVAPPTALVVGIPYAIGRVYRDIRESLESAEANKLLDEAGTPNAGCP